MATGTNHWKLGLFVVVGLALLVAALVVLGASNFTKATVEYTSYFDESVQGLERGSPVKFRGVSIGRVADIDIAPDRRHVAVVSELTLQKLAQLDLVRGDEAGDEPELVVHPDLRVQLAQTGITGVKFVLLDFFDGTAPPPPLLPFAVPTHYIPAAPSTLKSLESSVVAVAERAPDIAVELSETAARVNGLVEELDRSRLPEHTVLVLEQASLAMKELGRALKQLETGRLSRELSGSLSAFDATLARVDGLIARFDGDRGLLDSSERTAEAMAEVARGARTLGPELELTLREVRGAARAVRRFVETLERDPDMLLKGRAAEAR